MTTAPTPMPGLPFAQVGYKLTKKAVELGGASITAMLNAGWTHEMLMREGMIEGIPAVPAWPPAAGPESAFYDPTEKQPGSPRTSLLLEQYGEASKIAACVVDQVLERDAHGRRKYGVSLDRTDLDTPDWLQHMAEELMDGAHYALAAKTEIRRRSELIRENYAKALNTAQDQARAMLSDADYKVAERVLKVFNTALYELERKK